MADSSNALEGNPSLKTAFQSIQPLGIKPLTPPGPNSNYLNWAFAFELLIREARLSYVLEDTKPSDRPDSWERDCLKVSTMLVKCSEEPNYSYMRHCGTDPRKMWLALQEAHQNAATDNRTSCLIKLISTRLIDLNELDTHLDTMLHTFNHLNEFITPQSPLTSDNVFVSALLASLPIEWSEFITSWSKSSHVDSTTIIRAIQNERNLRDSCADETYQPLATGSTSPASHLFRPNSQDCSFDTTTTTSAFHIKQEQSQDSDSFQFTAPCPSSLNTTITHEPMSFRSQSIGSPHEEIFASKNNYLNNRSDTKSHFTISKDSLLSSQSSFAKHHASHESVEPMTRLIERSDTKVSPKVKSELPIFRGTIDASKKCESYSIGDMVLAKVNGWPAWPARIMEHSRAPDDLHLKGRRAASNTYLLRFFETANYCWVHGNCMSSLGPAEIKEYLNMSFDFEKGGLALKRAFEIALKPKAWEADLDGEALDSKFDVSKPGFYVEDEAPALPPKSPIDEMNEMDEILGISFQSKGKRGTDAKLLAEAQKLSRLMKSHSFKFKESIEKETVPVAKKVKTENRVSQFKKVDEEVVFDWKFKLQRAFLGKTELTTEKMYEMDCLFQEIESCDIKIEWLINSKLHKVIKQISRLEEEDEANVSLIKEKTFHFIDRAKDLYQKWKNQNF